MKVIVTTSDRYLHLLPVFAYLFNRYFDREQKVTVLGYSQPPCVLPANFKFVTMGKQGDVSEWSTDLRRYFERMEETHFVWLMEDCLIKRADKKVINQMYINLSKWGNIGRCDLTNDVQKRPHRITPDGLVWANSDTNYRLSTQASIWNKEFLLQYLTPGLTPWAFEKQNAINDGWSVVGELHPPMKVNEGVRKDNIHKLDLNGFPQEDIDFINTLL